MRPKQHCTFQSIAGTQRYVCTVCGFETTPMAQPPRVRICTSSGKPLTLPPIGTQAVRYLTAIERWRAAGKPERTDEEVDQILREHCSQCVYFDAGRCKHEQCGCRVRSSAGERETFLGRYVSRGLVNKLRMATERCPLNKWHASGPVRVCFVAVVWAVGGVERWLIDLARLMDPAKARIVRVVVTSKGGLVAGAEKWLPPGIEIIESTEIVDDGSFDCVVTWGQLDLSEKIRRLSCPVIDVQHACHPSDQWTQPLVQEAIKAHTLRGVHLAAVSELCREQFPPEVRGKISVIPNGADPERVKPTGRKPLNLPLPPGAKVALYVGRISPEKNVQAVIDAVNYAGHPWHAVIVGPQRLALTRITERIHLVGEQSQIGDWLAMADALVHPSSFESHGLAVNEAWLAGVPVVSCSYPVNRQFEERHGPLMWLVPVGPTAEQLAAAILQADRDDPRVGRAREVALREYTAQVMAERWGELIWSVCRKTVPQTAPGTI